MKRKLVVGLFILVGALAACSKSDDKKSSEPAAGGGGMDAVFASYEQCRALLAADKGEGVSECAGAMATAAKAANQTALAQKAEALAAISADDMPALRLAFGAVSEQAVAVLMADAELAKKYHLFECPMAKGYQRWIQPTAKLENPYMGQQMLTCGSEVHDHHMKH